MIQTEVRRQTLRTLLAALAAGLLCAGAVYAKNVAFAEGVVLGTVSGALGLWLMQRRLETIGTVQAERLQRTIYEWMVVRMVIYAIGFGFAYLLDRTHTYGVVGAVAGMLVFRGVFIAVTLAIHRRRKGGA